MSEEILNRWGQITVNTWRSFSSFSLMKELILKSKPNMEIARKSVGPIPPNMVLSMRDRRKREEKSERKVSLLFRHERRKFFFKRAVNCWISREDPLCEFKSIGCC